VACAFSILALTQLFALILMSRAVARFPDRLVVLACAFVLREAAGASRECPAAAATLLHLTQTLETALCRHGEQMMKIGQSGSTCKQDTETAPRR